MSDNFNSIPHYAMNEGLLTEINYHLNGLINKYSKLIMFRLDFQYRSSSDAYFHQDHHDMFFDIVRIMNFSLDETNVIGYFWVMENSKRRGIHFHAAFYLNGQLNKSSRLISLKVQKKWEEITGGDGYVHHCSPNKKKYPVTGEKIFSYKDEKLINDTRYILSYMAKKAQKRVQLIYGMSKVQHRSERGRPRMYL